MVLKAFCYFQMYWLGKVIFVTKTSCTNLNLTIIGNLMEKICQYFIQVVLKNIITFYYNILNGVLFFLYYCLTMTKTLKVKFIFMQKY